MLALWLTWQKQIITTLVPDNQTQQAINSALHAEFKDRLKQSATTLVTGGTGFIGGQLVNDLVSRWTKA